MNPDPPFPNDLLPASNTASLKLGEIDRDAADCLKYFFPFDDASNFYFNL